MNDILVVGVGNNWRRDDGIGPAVVQLLEEKPKKGVDYLDGGIDALALLDTLQKYRKIIIIDAVHMGKPSGTVKLFTPEEAKLIVRDALSTHGFGLAELLQLLEQLKIELMIKIVGVEPFDTSFGEGLSAEISAQLPQIISLINGEL